MPKSPSLKILLPAAVGAVLLLALYLALGDPAVRSRGPQEAANPETETAQREIAASPESAGRGRGERTGSVVDAASGEPVAGARVWIARPADGLAAGESVRRTDPEGRFRLTGLAPGREVEIHAEAPFCAPEQPLLPPLEVPGEHVRIELLRYGTAVLRFETAAGDLVPADGVQVDIASPAWHSANPRNAPAAAAAGEWRLHGVPFHGKVVFRIASERWKGPAFHMWTVDFADGLSRHPVPLPPGEVMLTPYLGASPETAAWSPARAEPFRFRVEPGAGVQTVPPAFRGAKVRLTVLSSDGVRRRGFDLRAWGPSLRLPLAWQDHWDAAGAAMGADSVLFVPEGETRIAVSLPGHRGAETVMTSRGDGERLDLTLRLSPAYEVDLRASYEGARELRASAGAGGGR